MPIAFLPNPWDSRLATSNEGANTAYPPPLN